MLIRKTRYDDHDGPRPPRRTWKYADRVALVLALAQMMLAQVIAWALKRWLE